MSEKSILIDALFINMAGAVTIFNRLLDGLVEKKINFVLIGDLSFFYDMNALWGANYGSNVRILLINNGGGEIFKGLPMKLSDPAGRYVYGTHQTKAAGWANERGFSYISAHTQEDLDKVLPAFTDPNVNQAKPILMEVFTDTIQDIANYKSYYHSLKNK